MEGCAHIHSIEPIRVNKIFSVQNAMTETLVGYTRSVSKLMEDKPGHTVNEIIDDMIQQTYSISTSMDEVKDTFTEKRKELIKASSDYKSGLKSAIDTVHSMAAATQSGKKTLDIMNNMSEYVKNSFSVDKVEKLNNKINTFGQKIEKVNNKIDLDKDVSQVTDMINNSVPQSKEFVDSILKMLSDKNLNELQDGIEQLKEDTKLLNESEALE